MLLRNRIARVTATGVLVLTAPLLTSCGFNYATDKVYTPAPGVNDRDGRVDVLNAMVVATADGKGTFVASLVNNETPKVENGKLTDVDDQLTGLEGSGGSTLTATLKEPITIPGGGLVKLADGNGIPVEGDSIKLGSFVEVTLTFENAEPATMKVPVVPNNGHYAGQDGTSLTPTEAPEGYSTPNPQE
jgi:hypothetical protein